MAGYRFWLQRSLSLVVALALVHTANAQVNWSGTSTVPQASSPSLGMTAAVCKVYSLSDLGDDPKLCKWIADTIPEMIQPASWKQADAKISLYAPSKILVVSNTPAVHGQVEEFLQNMRKSVVQARPTMATPGLMPAQFAVPDMVRVPQGVQTGPGGYPIPMAPQGPKHLFHFIIRYEGEGIVDSNVVKMMQAYKEAEKVANPSESLRSDVMRGTPPLESAPPAPPIVGTGTTTSAAFPKSSAPLMPPADPPPAPPTSPPPLTLPTLPPSPPLSLPVPQGPPMFKF